MFNKKDFVAAEKFWSSNYIQHSAHIPTGRDGLLGLVKRVLPEVKYENSLIMAEGDMLMLHGRFSGLGLPANWIVVDIVRMENGLLAEHWDVIEDEVTREKSVSGLPMFWRRFPRDDRDRESGRRVVRGASGLAASNDCSTIESIRDFDARSRSTLTIFGLRPSRAGHELTKKRENQYACNEGGTIYWL